MEYTLLKNHKQYPQSYNKSYRSVLRSVGKAIKDFNMIEEGDHIMVAVSGGKDSMTLLFLLDELKHRAPVSFTFFAYTLDQGQPGFNSNELEKFYQNLGIAYHIVTKDTFSIVTDKIPENKTYCSLCSRLRRGILYSEAKRLGANKIALGHHSDDAIETLLLNLFYSGKLAAISGKLYSDTHDSIVIRPLIYANEKDISRIAKEKNFPIIPCNLCGNQENLKRQEWKAFLEKQEKENPYLKSSMKAALSNVIHTHLWESPNVKAE